HWSLRLAPTDFAHSEVRDSRKLSESPARAGARVLPRLYPGDLHCYRPKSSRFAKILCPRITPIDANHDRVSSRNLGTFGVRGALAPLSMLGSIQSDTKTCRTPKASRNRAEIPSYSRSFVSFAG